MVGVPSIRRDEFSAYPGLIYMLPGLSLEANTASGNNDFLIAVPDEDHVVVENPQDIHVTVP